MAVARAWLKIKCQSRDGMNTKLHNGHFLVYNRELCFTQYRLHCQWGFNLKSTKQDVLLHYERQWRCKDSLKWKKVWGGVKLQCLSNKHLVSNPTYSRYSPMSKGSMGKCFLQRTPSTRPPHKSSIGHFKPIMSPFLHLQR